MFKCLKEILLIEEKHKAFIAILENKAYFKEEKKEREREECIC